VIPSLDGHAHLQLDVTRGDLDTLGSAGIMAVTRSPEEWPGVLRRRDTRVAWGVGCHPGVARALRLYDESLFAAVAKKASFVGEVGLDGRSATPSDLQRRVFRSILRVAAGEGLILSVHSLGRTAEVLDLIEESRATNVILHWWTGGARETTRAVGLGLYFSVNGAVRPDTLAMLPPDRVITETDFPLTVGIDPAASKPGRIDTVVVSLARQWDCDASDVRSRSWQALRALDGDRGTLARGASAFGIAIASLRSNAPHA
jgi:TatD DNase family protein